MPARAALREARRVQEPLQPLCIRVTSVASGPRFRTAALSATEGLRSPERESAGRRRSAPQGATRRRYLLRPSRQGPGSSRKTDAGFMRATLECRSCCRAFRLSRALFCAARLPDVRGRGRPARGAGWEAAAAGGLAAGALDVVSGGVAGAGEGLRRRRGLNAVGVGTGSRVGRWWSGRGGRVGRRGAARAGGRDPTGLAKSWWRCECCD